MAAASIPRPTTFSWGENFQRFLDRFEEYVTLITPPDRLDMLLLSMVDGHTWDKISTVKMDGGNAGADWKSIALVKEFYKGAMERHEDKRSAQAAFMMIKQGESETVVEYARRVEEMSNRAYSDKAISAEFRIPIFIRGIRENRVRLALVTGDDKSFDELVKTANRIEQASIVMDSPGDLRVFSSSSVGKRGAGVTQGFLQMEQHSQGNDQSFRASPQSRPSGNSNPGGYECFTCGQVGDHFQRDCKHLQCFNCKGNHMARDCNQRGANLGRTYGLSTRVGIPRGGYGPLGGSRGGRGGKGPNYYNLKCTFCDRFGHLEATCFQKNPNLIQGLNSGVRQEGETRTPQ